MKVVRYVDAWEGARADELILVAERFLTSLRPGSKRFRVEFELDLPEPVVDGKCQAKVRQLL